MQITEKDKLFFTSDTHFFHEKIISLTNRPFSGVREMNEILIKNWNSVVPEDGIVFHLGDFAMTGNIGSIKSILEQLNGEIFLIYGNHDFQNKFNRDAVKALFSETFYYIDLHVKDEEVDGGEQRLFLCHYPMGSWAGKQRGSWNLFGHIHSKFDDPMNALYQAESLDVGVDANNYCPISYNDVCKIITQKILHKNDKIIVKQTEDGVYCSDSRVNIIKIK